MNFMNVEQKLMELGALELRRCGTAESKAFIANRLAENTMGEVCLMESICAVDNRREARKRVEENKGAPGVDGVKTTELAGVLNRCWGAIKTSLLEGTYEPLPVRRKSIDKPDGGTRDLGIPVVQDRFVQQAMTQVLTHLYDHTFSDSSFGYRPGRSQAQAVERARWYVQRGANYVVSIDLSKFFDRVNHDRLMSRLAMRIKDKRVLKLIRAFLNSGITLENDETIYPGEGTPQGGPLSPLLSNIVLDELDKELERRGLRFVRYADDIVIFVRTRIAGERVLKSVTRFLRERMKLKVNEDKSRVDQPWDVKFLGFRITQMMGKTRLSIHPKALERFKDKVRETTRRGRGVSLQQVIIDLNRFIPGWLNYFRVGLSKKLLQELNSWVVRRLRAFHWEQWKLPRTKVKNLKKLGLKHEDAVKMGNTRKGAWRISKCQSINYAMPAKWFIKNYGLTPLR
jgi:RNA-directed DNA polymerase